MTEIQLDRAEMRETLKKPEARAAELLTRLDGFSASGDFGMASDKIALIVRLALESAQQAAITTQAVCVIAHEAVDDLTTTEESIMDALDNFAEEELG